MGRAPAKRMLRGVASFRVQPAADGLAGDAQRQLGGGPPLRRGPLPGVADGFDARMFEPEFAGRDARMVGGTGNPAGNQVAAPLQSLTQRGGEKRMRLFCRFGANPPQSAVSGQAELAGGIAEGQLKFLLSARENQITERNLGGAAHGF